MEKVGNVYKVFGGVKKFCKHINEKGFQTCEQSDGHVIQISNYHSPYIIGKIFEREILIVHNNKNKDNSSKEDSLKLENLVKGFKII